MAIKATSFTDFPKMLHVNTVDKFICGNPHSAAISLLTNLTTGVK